jgi:hypothetical protein
MKLSDVLNWSPEDRLSDEEVVNFCEAFMSVWNQADYPQEYGHFNTIRSQHT